MGYANLASATKLHRTNQIVADIGLAGYMQLWSGIAPPASPDMTPTGVLLVTLPLSSVAGVVSLGVRSGIVTAQGTGGANGVYDLSIIGDGSDASGSYTVAESILSEITINAVGHDYTTPPTLGGFTTAGLTGASAVAVMTSTLVFSSIAPATAVATGNAHWARVTTAGLGGILDLDVGTTNAFSVVMDNTFINAGSFVTCSAQIVIEA